MCAYVPANVFINNVGDEGRIQDFFAGWDQVGVTNVRLANSEVPLGCTGAWFPEKLFHFEEEHQGKTLKGHVTEKDSRDLFLISLNPFLSIIMIMFMTCKLKYCVTVPCSEDSFFAIPFSVIP